MKAQLEVIFGPMFSGKSGELLRRIQRALWARRTVAIAKPGRDTRTEACIATRQVHEDLSTSVKDRHSAFVITSPQELQEVFRSKPNVVAIDEVQFFESWIVDAIWKELCSRRDDEFRIIVSGLDLDYALQPFGPTLQLVGMSDEHQHMKGVCMACGADGCFTQRLSGTTAQHQVGDTEYQVRCRNCHYVFTGT